MEISDLKSRMGNVDIEAEVTDISEVREFEKYGKVGRVATATIKDETGEIPLSLWNEQIDNVKVGDSIKITNGYVSEWQDKAQLTAGKFGTLEVVKKKK